MLENKENYEKECEEFTKIFDKISSKHVVKNWNNVESQAEYFENKFSNELNLDFLLGNPVNKELVRSILQLDNSSKTKIQFLKLINTRKGLLGDGQ